jgi:hypothetical protein
MPIPESKPDQDVGAKPESTGPAPRERIEYLQSFRYIFTEREWIKSLVFFSLFILIPILQTPLIFGYAFEVTEHLIRRGPGVYPLFEVRGFGRYVTRGIWCYLVTNIVGFIIAPVIQVVTQGGMFGTMAAIQADQSMGLIIVCVVLPLLVIGFLIFVASLGIVLTPIYLRAGLSQDFVETFRFRWIGDFIRRMWLESLLVNLFATFSSLVVMLLGCVLLCYGIFLAGALMALVGAHLNYQIYELYLARGGEPIPLKPLPGEVPPVIGQ